MVVRAGSCTSTRSGVSRKRDDRAIHAQITRAEKVAAGQARLRRARFLKVTGATKALDDATIAGARQLAGPKVYVTNLGIEQMSGGVSTTLEN